MHIPLIKFGSTLVSRPAGKESYLAFQPSLREIKSDEKIEIDFANVVVLTPSWADEFITPLEDEYKDRVVLINTENPSVKATLETLKKAQSAQQNN